MPRAYLFARAFLAIADLGIVTSLRGNPVETGRPILRSYDVQEVHSKGPVLAFAETADNYLLVGSNSLILFDGLRWQGIDVPGAYAFRGLAAANPAASGRLVAPRVWVGAADALGYVERDRQGVWNFVSLSSALRAAGESSPGEISFAAALGEGAIFASSHKLYRWDGAKFEVWTLATGEPVHCVADGPGAVWALQAGAGLFRIEKAGGPKEVAPATGLPAGSVEWLTRLDSAQPGDANGLIVGTSSGAYRRNGAGWARLEPLSERLAGAAPTGAIVAADDQLAVATSRDGVVLAKADGSVTEKVDRAAGLRDDTIYGLWNDTRGRIWVGLDEGCARLDSVGGVSVFDAREGLREGLPRKVVRAFGHSYVLTDKALYRMEVREADTHLTPLAGLVGDPADVAEGIDGLWITTSTGLWHLEEAERISRVEAGTGMGALLRLSEAPGDLLNARNGSFYLVHTGTNAPASAENLRIKAPLKITSIVEDDQGRVWYSSPGKGVIRIARSPTDRRWVSEGEVKREGEALEGAGRLQLAVVGGRVFAFSDSQILSFDEGSGFVASQPLSGWEGIAAARQPTGDRSSFWLVRYNVNGTDPAPYDLWQVSVGTDGQLRTAPLRAPGFDWLGEVTSMDVTDEAGKGPVWIGGSGGLVRVDPSHLDRVGSLRRVQFREVRVEGGGQSFLDLQPPGPVRIEAGARRILFSYSAAQPMETAPIVYYQTRLAGVEPDWSVPDRRFTREFTGLPPGSYTFMVRRLDRHGQVGSEASYAFILVAPWYERPEALAGYILLLVLAIAWFLRIRVRSLRRRAEQLDRLVAQRTRQLELSNTAKSEFLENISHEIRNPLNGILGLTNLLKPEALPVEQREIAHFLKDSAHRLKRLSEDVLDFSQIELGNFEVHREFFHLRRLLEEVVAQQRAAAALNGCELALEAPETDDGFVGDASKIATIVGNFLANAAKYAPGAPILVRADWTDEESGLTQVYVDVTDSGPGIPPEEQELIFQKFVRGSNTKKGQVMGSGLGLAMCRTYAQRLGGAVGVESPATDRPGPGAGGPGSTFHLWLPLARSAPSPVPGPVEAVPPQEIEEHAHGSGDWTAVIADDEAFNRTVLAGMSRELGYRPVVASNAKEAIELALKPKVAVVFFDQEMPGMKGDEAARQLSRVRKGRLPVMVMVTGQGSAEVRERWRRAGMDGFLLKPFDLDKLRTLLRSLALPTAKAPTEGGPTDALEFYAKAGDVSREESVKRFIAAINVERAALARATDSLDREVARSVGHRLRSLAALVRDASLNKLASDLEASARQAEPPALAQLAAEIEAAAVSLCREMAASSPAPSSSSRQ